MDGGTEGSPGLGAGWLRAVMDVCLVAKSDGCLGQMGIWAKSGGEQGETGGTAGMELVQEPGSGSGAKVWGCPCPYKRLRGGEHPIP